VQLERIKRQQAKTDDVSWAIPTRSRMRPRQNRHPLNESTAVRRERHRCVAHNLDEILDWRRHFTDRHIYRIAKI
jgi:hypothetical protein